MWYFTENQSKRLRVLLSVCFVGVVALGKIIGDEHEWDKVLNIVKVMSSAWQNKFLTKKKFDFVFTSPLTKINEGNR